MKTTQPIPTSRLAAGVLLAAVVGILQPGLALAGSIPLAWDPVSDPDIAGYRVYYGTSPDSYPSSRDAGNVTTYTLGGLDDCTRYYIAVKAYTSSGQESNGYSNEISGLPTPVVSGAAPSGGERGQSLTVQVDGWSYDSGATVTFSDPAITVDSTTRVSCNRVDAAITIASDAPLGWSRVDVSNPDGSKGGRDQTFEVRAASGPSVSATKPADGASNVAVSVRPTVTFSEEMDPSSITPGTVQLLGPGDVAVGHASGSPNLDGAGVVATIIPSSELDADTVYRIRVVGGEGGVRDLQGTAMESTFEQSQGFRTAAEPDATPPTVASTLPAAGERSVKVHVRPTVTFSEVMDAATITPATVRLVATNGGTVPQAAGSPALDSAGTVAKITPAVPLAESSFYRIEVIGGAAGVKDVSGDAMAADFLLDPAFLTWGKGKPPDKVDNVRRKDTK